MESLKNFIPFKKQQNTEEIKGDDFSQLDMLEKGLTCNYNPGLFV